MAKKLAVVSTEDTEKYLLRAGKAAVVKVFQTAAEVGAKIRTIAEQAVGEFSAKHGLIAFHIQSAIAENAVVLLAEKWSVSWGGNYADKGNALVAAMLGCAKINDPRISNTLNTIRNAARVHAKKNGLKVPVQERKPAELVGSLGPSISIAVKNAEGKWAATRIFEGKVGDKDVDDEVLNVLLGALTDAQIDRLATMSRKRAMVLAQERVAATKAAAK